MRVVTVARRPIAESSVAANILEHGVGAINVDGTRVEGVPTSFPVRRNAHAPLPGDARNAAGQGMYAQPASDQLGPPHPGGRWPANLILRHADECRRVDAWACVAGCPVAALDAGGDRPVSGTARGAKAATSAAGDGVTFSESLQTKGVGTVHDDSGGAARYFKQVGGQR